jgi:hypothetical protein
VPALDGKACNRDGGTDSVSVLRLRDEGQRWYGMSSETVLRDGGRKKVQRSGGGLPRPLSEGRVRSRA